MKWAKVANEMDEKNCEMDEEDRTKLAKTFQAKSTKRTGRNWRRRFRRN